MTNSPNWLRGTSKLVLISDLIEKSRFANFFAGAIPDFDSWVKDPNHRAIVEAIKFSKGDQIQICQLLTDKPSALARERALAFWQGMFSAYGSKIQLSCNGVVQ